MSDETPIAWRRAAAPAEPTTARVTFRATTLPDGTRTSEVEAHVPPTDSGTAFLFGLALGAAGLALLLAASSPRSRA